MRKHFVAVELEIKLRKIQIQTHAANVVGKQSSVQKPPAAFVICSKMNECCTKLLAVAEAVKNGHSFSSDRRGAVQKAACAVSASFIEKDISPPRRANWRIPVKDGRAVCNKDCVEIIRKRMVEVVGEWFIIISGCFYTVFKAIAEIWAAFGLGQPRKCESKGLEPWLTPAMMNKFIFDERRACYIKYARHEADAQRKSSTNRGSHSKELEKRGHINTVVTRYH